MSGTVLVTGAFAPVGVPTVGPFAADGWLLRIAAPRRVVGKIFMIADDDIHGVRQGELLQAMAAARGLVGYPASAAAATQATIPPGIPTATGWTPRPRARTCQTAVENGLTRKFTSTTVDEYAQIWQPASRCD